MEQTFYSHGKLLISAEYLVVDGATALALPCKFGQDLTMKNLNNSVDKNLLIISWESYNDKGEMWFSSVFEYNHLEKKFESKGNGDSVSEHLEYILETALNMSSTSLYGNIEVKTKLEFPQDWGLGSSSTLLANVAKWLQVDMFELYYKTTNGSGYDIACADAKTPILFSRNNNNPIVETFEWNPPFASELFFVHLGSKAKSDKEVTTYKTLQFNREEAVAEMNKLTSQILNCVSLNEFEKLVEKHDEFLSNILNRPTIKQQLFSDYQGCVKSLGAWGGDFILVSSLEGFRDYFANKNCGIIIPYHEMRL